MIFRHLSEIYSLLSGVPLEVLEHFKDILEAHILAIVYQQLFSTYESWFLRVNKRTLYAAISRFKSRFSERELRVWQHVGDIIKTYNLNTVISTPQLESIMAIIGEVFPESTNST